MGDLLKAEPLKQRITILNEVMESLSSINGRMLESCDRLHNLSKKAGVYEQEPTEAVSSEPTETFIGASNYMLYRLKENCYALERRIAELENFI